jgi:small basic protein (TIGR04137 family)
MRKIRKKIDHAGPLQTGPPDFFTPRAIFGLPAAPAGANLRPPRIQPPHTMSKHNSLKQNASVGGKRSVLKRFERVKLLKERGEWKAGRSPIGLPKTKHEG